MPDVVDRVLQLRDRYRFMLGEKEKLESQLDELGEREELIRKASALVQEVAQTVQSNLQDLLSSFVTEGLEAVFPDPYQFKVEFVPRRKQVEVEMSLVRDGMEVPPLDSTGGGVVDVVGFMLRLAFWAFTQGGRPIMLIDEPFKNLSADLHELAGELLKGMSERLGIQLLTITHLRGLISQADKVFTLGDGEYAGH